MIQKVKTILIFAQNLIKSMPELASFIGSKMPYLGIFIRFIPQYIKLCEVLNNRRKEGDHRHLVKEVNLAIDKIQKGDFDERLQGLEDLNDITNDRFK